MSRIEAIEAAIRNADADGCIAALTGVPEPERNRMAHRIAELAVWDPSAVLQRDFQRRRAQHSVAVLALFGTASLGQIKRVRVFDSACPVFPVLAERRPGWLADWAEWTLDRPGFPHFPDVRRLIRAGLIPRPRTDGYILAVISCLVPHGNVRERLASDPDVFTEDVWRFFEVEGSQSTSLASVDKFSGGWKDGLIHLSNEGLLDRARLLDGSLDALERDFPPFRAAWFSAFHEALKPTLGELEQRSGRYLGLLGSRVPATVSFAMKAVARADKAGLLVPAEVCSQIGPAIAARQKGVVSDALKVLARIAAATPALAPAVAEAASGALAHSSPEIQKLAIDLVERHGDSGVARNYADALAPSQRARLGVTVIEDEEPLPERPPASRIEPIASLDELVEAFAAVLEKEEPPEEIERVLEGVSRLRAVPARRFDALTAPLVARAEKLPGAVLSPVLMAWTRGVRPRGESACAGLISFLRARVHEAAERVLQRNSAPLTGTPSHSGGFLDPRVFVERLRANPDPGALDLIQGLLRLSPDHRPEALRDAEALGGEIGKAVRYALGSNVRKGPVSPSNDALWTAAAQARDPHSGAPSYSLEWRRETRQYVMGQEYTHLLIDLKSNVVANRIDFPGDLSSNPGTQDAAMLRWCGTVWPGNREGFYAAGAQVIARNLDWWSAEWGNRAYLDTLAAETSALGPMAYELLALGLACKEPGEALAASNALIYGLAEGRISGAVLGETCARIATQGKVTISRWTRRLGAVAQMRRAFARELFAVQDRLLAAEAPIATNEMSGFLELLCELRAQSGLDLSHEARARLAKSAPGGKSARLAKSLL